MFSIKAVVVITSLLAVVPAQNLPAPNCITAGSVPATDCTPYIDIFCDNASASQNSVRVGDSTGRCYNLDTEARHSCQFIAQNTYKADVPPSITNCKSVLTNIVSKCQFGGAGAVSPSAYTFFVDKNARNCTELTRID